MRDSRVDDERHMLQMVFEALESLKGTSFGFLELSMGDVIYCRTVSIFHSGVNVIKSNTKKRIHCRSHLMKQTDLQPSSHKHTKPSLQITKSKPQLRKHVNSVVSKKNVKKKSYATRRSGRIRNTAISSKSRSSEPYIEEIPSSASEDEKEEEEPTLQVEKNMAKPTTEGLEQKIDNLGNMNPSCTKNPYPLDATYKSMYVDSQKKIVELKEVIRQLTQKLDTALCKVEVYEKCTQDSLEMYEKLKDLALVLSLGKVPETAIDVQCEALHNAIPPSEPNICGSKRKKVRK